MLTAGPEREPVALIDLDGTIYRGLILEQMVQDQMHKGLIQMARVPEILSSVINYHKNQKGHPSVTEDLNYCWADACETIPYNTLLEHARTFVTENRNRFYPFIRPVLDLLRQRQIDSWIITGEPDFVARAVADEFGATGYFASIWKQKRGTITGGVKVLVNSHVKGRCAEVLFNHNYFNYRREGSFALVDSVNDIGLVDSVPFSVVCGQPDEAFKEYLTNCGKNYMVIPPANTERMINTIDRLTKGAK